MPIERTPASLVLPLLPSFTQDSIHRPRLNESGELVLEATAASSPEATVEGAIRARRRLSAHYHRRWQRGDKEAPLDLLELNPAFIGEPWVQEALEVLARQGKLGERGRWRGGKVGKVVVVALINQLTERLGNLDRAFRYLAERGYLSYDRLRHLYYEGVNDGRLRPLLFLDKASSVTVSDDEYAIRMACSNPRVLGKDLAEYEGSIGEIKFRISATGKSRR